MVTVDDDSDQRDQPYIGTRKQWLLLLAGPHI